MSTESPDRIQPKKRVREEVEESRIFCHNITGGSRVRYVRVKDVGTRITDIEKRNKRIVEIAVPLPEDKRLSGRAVYWFVTTEEVEVMFEDNRLFVWKERIQVLAADGTSYFLNQFDFRKQKGMIFLRFSDEMMEVITCYSPNKSNSNKRVKFNSTVPVSMSLINNGVSALQIDEQLQYCEDNSICINNANQGPETIPTFDLINGPSNDIQYSLNHLQQAPQTLSNGVQVSANEPIIINILLLVPDIKEYIEMAEKALLQIGFVKEVSSENQQRLYSEKDLVKRQRHVLLFPYGKTHRYSKIEDRLSFASEVILLLENNNQSNSALMAVARVLNVKNNSMNTRHFTVKTETVPTIEIAYKDLTWQAQQLFFINELSSTVLGGISCKHEADVASFFLEWNLGPVVGSVVPNVLICFKYEPMNIKAFTEYAKISLDALGINSDSEALVVNGSVLVYVQCPSYIPWYIIQNADEIFHNLKEEQLIEIYECSVTDIDVSLAHPNNEEFIDEMAYFKELLNSNGMASQESPKRITAKQNEIAALLKHRDMKHDAADYQGAIEDVNKADQIEPDDVFILKKRAGTKYLLDDYQGALEDLNRADEIQPNNAVTLRTRGETKRMLEDYKGALEDLNRADKIAPNNAITLQNRGDAKRQLRDYQGALEDFTRADKIKPNNAFTLRYRGDAKRMLGDLKGALEDLNRADLIEPNNAVTLRTQGETKRMLEDYEGALEDLNRADNIQPNNAFTLRVRGDTKRQLRDYQGALEDLNRADEIEPNDAFTLRVRGDAKRMLEDYKGALEDLNRANEIEPNNVFTLYNRGATKHMLYDHQGGLKDLNRADEIEPNDAFTLRVRGDAKRMLGDYEGALKDFNRADEIKPNDAFTRRMLQVTKTLDGALTTNINRLANIDGETKHF